MAQLNEWLSISKTSGTGNAEITLTASSYEELTQRTESLVVKGQSENKKVYVNVIQTALVPSATLDSYEITAYTEGTYTNGITSNVPWTAVVNGNWITIDKTQGESGYTPLSITVDASTETRSGSIIFNAKGVVLTLQIYQIYDLDNSYFWVEFDDVGGAVCFPPKDYPYASINVEMTYSFDGAVWTNFNINNSSPIIEMGGHKKIYLYNKSHNLGGKWTGIKMEFLNKTCRIGGNASALTEMHKYALQRTFAYNSLLLDASDLILPWDVLSEGCYSGMFTNCNNLVTAPELPATVLANSCYLDMFSECHNLTTAPVLPATVLADSCYSLMFADCPKLSYIEIYAQTTAVNCFNGWVDLYSLDDIGNSSGTLPEGIGVASEGVFVLHSNIFIPQNSSSGIPTGWEIIRRGGYIPKTEEELKKEYFWAEFEEIETLISDIGNMVYSFDGINWFDGDSSFSMGNNKIIYFASMVENPNIAIKCNKYVKIGGKLPKGSYPHFQNNTYLTDASELIFDDVAVGRCARMFKDCTSLVTAPAVLPANVLTEKCYEYMFEGCTSLTTAPELPATVLAKWCYYNMFKDCTSLVKVPAVLPATTLGVRCYEYMFRNCTSLTTAPALPATTLAGSCYSSMFEGCTSLVNAPALPATVLEYNCYEYMFRNCTSLTTAPELPATVLTQSCYRYMFEGCTSLVNAPALPATTLELTCYRRMFKGCTSLVNAPALPATVLTTECYSSMFEGCTSLVNAPELPTTTLGYSCYESMFKNCTSLTTAPALPATVLEYNCYNSMFYGCVKLNYIKMLATDISPIDCIYDWLYNVSSTGTFIKHPDAVLPSGVSGIPDGWTVETATE